MQMVPDKSVLQKVNQRLARMGGAQGKVNVAVSRGEVTLTGSIQYEMQRASIMKVATSVPGVRRVIDQLRLKPKERRMDPQPPPKKPDVLQTVADLPPTNPFASPSEGSPPPSPPASQMDS